MAKRKRVQIAEQTVAETLTGAENGEPTMGEVAHTSKPAKGGKAPRTLKYLVIGVNKNGGWGEVCYIVQTLRRARRVVMENKMMLSRMYDELTIWKGKQVIG